MRYRADDFLADPSVLLAAWERVQAHYRYGELQPEPEFSSWLLNPDDHLRQLGDSFSKGTYKPGVFPIIPYPKSGAILRHYTAPSVRDQVAFACFAVLLGPILDAQMSNFSFGNRWYRSVYKDAAKDAWQLRPYELHRSTTYQPNRRSHGLFRRVCHWSASRLTNSTAEWNISESVEAEYPESMLPPFVKPEWWQTKVSDSRLVKGFWAKLDLQLAYPSVRLSKLKEMLLLLVSEEHWTNTNEQYAAQFGGVTNSIDLYGALGGYPEHLRTPLTFNEPLRISLVDLLCQHLASIVYESEMRGDFWRPPHINNVLPSVLDESSEPGLPTGLLISGLLMNVYLNQFDNKMGSWLLMRKDDSPCAFVRFADDIVLMSSDEKVLLEGLDEIWRGLAGDSDAVLGSPSKPNLTNLRINWSKVKPPALAAILTQYLKEQKIEKCKKCGHYKQLQQVNDVPTIVTWWHSHSKEKRFARMLRKTAIDADRLGPFVTFLVERLSDVGSTDVFERFGRKASERLTDLQELIRLQLEDDDVRLDTRLLFAANRLAKAWLSDETPNQVEVDIKQIRLSIQEAIFKAPWKFQLWSAVIRAGCRRAPRQIDTQNELATEWLQSILKVISYTSKDPRSWLRDWPEEEFSKKCRAEACHVEDMVEQWKHAYLSFLRTYFWRSIAESILTLSRVAARIASDDAFERIYPIDGWTHEDWPFRILNEDQLEPVVSWLSDLDSWTEILYGTSESASVKLFSWELDAITLAYMAAATQHQLFDSVSNPDPTLQLPPQFTVPDLGEFQNTQTIALLRQHNRIAPTSKTAQRNVFQLPWLLTSKYSRSASAAISALLERAEFSQQPSLLAIAEKLDVTHLLSENSTTFWQSWLNLTLDSVAKGVASLSLFDLRTFSRARNLMLAQVNGLERNDRTIQRFVWGDSWSTEDYKDWKLAWCHAPSLGIPPRISLQLFRQIVQEIQATKCPMEPAVPETWVLSEETAQIISAGRRVQFGLDKYDPDETVNTPLNLGQSNFAFPNIPHPAFLLPQALRLVQKDSKKYRIWCAFLNFLAIAEGSERILDSFVSYGLGTLPFADRWSVRERIHLPVSVWRSLDKIRDWFTARDGWKDSPSKTRILLLDLDALQIKFMIVDLLQSIGDVIAENCTFKLRDFRWQQTDTLLTLTSGVEVPRAVLPWPSMDKSFELPEGVVATDTLMDLNVRIAQVQADIDWRRFYHDFPRLTRTEIQNIMRQVAQSFYSERLVAPDMSNQTQLVIMPEVLLPIGEVNTVKSMVAQTGVSALVGIQHRPLTPSMRPRIGHRPRTLFFVNEALFAVPLSIGGTSRTQIVRDFYIRKPIPAHVETGLARALSTPQSTWRFLPGTNFYRMVHPNWGDFTVSICADLLDPAPWLALQGQILHLFMCAHNEDIELYECLTWVRAYENYVNVVSANHGSQGGSFAWSPKHRHHRLLASIKGANVFVLADITLPVHDLLIMQREGIEREINRRTVEWQALTETTTPDLATRLRDFKSPPPSFRNRT